MRSSVVIRLGLSLGLALFSICAAACPIAVDVGHYRERPGATSARGIPEFEFNLALATKIKQALEKRGCEVIFIGADGNAKDLRKRTAAARRASFFLSVHHDSVQAQFLKPWAYHGVVQRYTDRFAGFSLFVSRENPNLAQSERCASLIGAGLRGSGFVPSLYHADAMPGEHRPFADKLNGVHYFDGLVVLKTAMQPAVLLEAGVILNRDEEASLASDETQQKMADTVASALMQCVTPIAPTSSK